MEDVICSSVPVPTIADNDGKNALHLLCQYDALPQEPAMDTFNPSDPFKEGSIFLAKEDYARKWKEQRELLRELLKFLLDKGVPTLAADKDGYIPLAYALEASYDVDHHATTHRKYYDNLALILNRMEEEADKLISKPGVQFNRYCFHPRICPTTCPKSFMEF